MSDELALGALQIARDIGTSVPYNLAVTDWDDTPAASAAGLTTLRQDLRSDPIVREAFGRIGRRGAVLGVLPTRRLLAGIPVGDHLGRYAALSIRFRIHNFESHLRALRGPGQFRTGCPALAAG